MSPHHQHQTSCLVVFDQKKSHEHQVCCAISLDLVVSHLGVTLDKSSCQTKEFFSDSMECMNFFGWLLFWKHEGIHELFIIQLFICPSVICWFCLFMHVFALVAFSLPIYFHIYLWRVIFFNLSNSLFLLLVCVCVWLVACLFFGKY